MSDAVMVWEDKFVKHEITPAGQLLANPHNFRVHSRAQQAALEGSLDDLQWIGAVKVNVQTGHIFDGHLRVTLALRKGEETGVPCDYYDLTPEQEAQALLSIDPIAAMAGTDKEQMETLLNQVNSDSEETQKYLADLAQREGLVWGQTNEDAEPQIDRAAELLEKWQVQTGDLWMIGEHRLLCGDSTKREDVERAMDGPADLVVTDPPYSVDYAAKNRALQTIGPSNRLTTDIEGDTLTTEETADTIWKPAFENAYNASRNGTVIYCFSPQGGDQMMMMMMMMMRAQWNDRLHQLIWRKNSPTFSMGRLDYQYQHEPILYTWRGTNHGFYGDTGRSVIDCDRPSESKLHPTMKPVELIEILINNSSQRDESVFDPFLGSGTTMVACQNLGRKCRGIEISPAYCAVILQRMSDAFPELTIEKV